MSKHIKSTKSSTDNKKSQKKKTGYETKKIILDSKHDKKVQKKAAKVTQIIKIKDTVDPKQRSHQTRLWAERQITRLSEKQRKNRKKYVILSSILSFFNLTVVFLACLALSQLIKASNIVVDPTKLNEIHAQIGLAAGAAAVTVIIFFLNIGIIFYRGFMKWFIYKDALDSIQVEVMKHQFLKGDYADSKEPDELLETKVKNITHAAISNKSHKKWKNLMMKALAGGEYE